MFSEATNLQSSSRDSLLQRRDLTRIVRDLLETAEVEVSQNQIMRRANLKTSQAKSYIILAKEKGWLSESSIDGARRYRRTIEGWHFLQLLAEVTGQLDRPAARLMQLSVRVNTSPQAIDISFAQSG